MLTFQDSGTQSVLWGTEDAQSTDELGSMWIASDIEALPLRPEAGCLQRWLDLNA